MIMSKKTEKEDANLKAMIEELIEEVKSLKSRIKKLERGNKYYPPFEEEPYPWRKKSRICPHCNGTGKIEDYNPYRYPYYGVD
jgi:hypothetical protein